MKIFQNKPFLVGLFFIATFLMFCIGFLSRPLFSKIAVPEKQRIVIVCTTSLIADAARAVCGDLAEVIQLMGPGVDPHVYKVRPSDVRALHAADMIFYNGLHLEGKMTEIFDALRHNKQKITAVTNALPKTNLIESSYPGVFDPHIWSDPLLWKQCVLYMYQTIAATYPEHASILAEGYKNYQQQLLTLDYTVEEMLSTIPKDKRILITAHDAFAYFGKRYNYTVLGLQGLSTETDIGLRDIELLIDYIITHNVHAVFVESCIAPRTMETIQERAKNRGHMIHIGGELFSDALGDQNSGADTYLTMLMHNVTTIVTALQQESIGIP